MAENAKETTRVTSVLVALLLFIALMPGCQEPGEPFAFTGKLLVERRASLRVKAGESSGTRELLELASGEPALQKPADRVLASFSPEDKNERQMILSVSAGGNLMVKSPDILLNVKTGARRKLPFPAHAGSLSNAVFSPSEKYIACLLFEPSKLAVYDIAAGAAKVVFTADHASYDYEGTRGGTAGERYAGIGLPAWLDDDTLFFYHRRGMPATVKSNELYTENRYVIMSRNGDTIRAADASADVYYRCQGRTIVRWSKNEKANPSYTEIDGYMDAAGFKAGALRFREIPYFNSVTRGFGMNVLGFSPDGAFVLVKRDKPDNQGRTVGVIELKTGKETMLDVKIDERVEELIWSPDNAALAYTSNEGKKTKLKIISILLNKSYVPGWSAERSTEFDRIKLVRWK